MFDPPGGVKVGEHKRGLKTLVRSEFNQVEETLLTRLKI